MQRSGQGTLAIKRRLTVNRLSENPYRCDLTERRVKLGAMTINKPRLRSVGLWDDMVWAEIAVAALAGSAFYGAVALTERAVTFWHPSVRKGR